MNSEGYDPRQDPDYQAYLASLTKADAPPPQEEPEYHPPTAYNAKPNRPTTPAGGYMPKVFEDRKSVPQTTDKNGQGWDRTIQQGEVIRVFQRSFKGRDRKDWFNGQLRLVVKEFKGNNFVSLENWKVHPDDISREPHSQKHEWKGAANIQVKELRALGNALIDLAESLDGGSV